MFTPPKPTIRFQQVQHAPRTIVKESKKETLYDPDFSYLSNLQTDGITSAFNFRPTINYDLIRNEVESEIEGNGKETGFSRLSLPVSFTPPKPSSDSKNGRYYFTEVTKFLPRHRHLLSTVFVSTKEGKEVPSSRCSRLRLSAPSALTYLSNRVRLYRDDFVVFGFDHPNKHMQSILVYAIDSFQEWPIDTPVAPIHLGRNTGLVNVRLVYIRAQKRDGVSKSQGPQTLEWMDSIYFLSESDLKEEDVLEEDGTINITHVRSQLSSPSFANARDIVNAFDRVSEEVEKRFESKRFPYPYREVLVPFESTKSMVAPPEFKVVFIGSFVSSLFREISQLENKFDKNSTRKEVEMMVEYNYAVDKKKCGFVTVTAFVEGAESTIMSKCDLDELSLLDTPQTHQLVRGNLEELKEEIVSTGTVRFLLKVRF